MVIYFFFGIVLAVGLYLLSQGFMRANPRQVASALRVVALLLAIGVVAFMAISGRLAWALFALPILLPWLLRLRTVARLFKSARGPSSGQTSTVNTPSLDMELDHDSGEMDGEILAGPMEGRRLSDLDPVLLLDFYRWCCANDEQAARLLEAYLDRTIGGEWREEPGAGGASARQPDSGGMTEEEAWNVLGLEPGADDAAIRAAHRRLMQHAHPDRGGSAYLAAKINAAKDLLLSR